MRMPPTLGSSADIARTTLRTRAAAGLTRGAATTYGADVPPLPRLAERIVFIVHGVVTIAAAILLAVLPGVIPATVGIAMDRVDDLMAYLLAAVARDVPPGTELTVLTTDPAARYDVPAWARMRGHEVTSSRGEGGQEAPTDDGGERPAVLAITVRVGGTVR